jgi:hypothetical protein
LPALSGITNRVRGAGTYMGGTFEHFLKYDLLWFTTADQLAPMAPRRPDQYIAPSFLWPSAGRGVSFVNIDENTPDLHSTFTIETIRIIPKDEDSLENIEMGI